MAVEIGTASGYLDLLDKLVTFATGLTAPEAWTVDRNITAADGERELIMHGPGLDGSQAIYVGVRSRTNADSDSYNWRLMGCTGYVAGNAWWAQPNSSNTWTSGNSANLLLWDQAIPYWFIGSGRRLIVVAKVSTVYETAYLGYALPYATPGQYPYPLVVAGTSDRANQRWDWQGDGHSALWRPLDPNVQWRTADGEWRRLREANTKGDDQVNPGLIDGSLGDDWREAPDGTRWLLPLVGVSYGPDNYLGELDGLAVVPGFGIAAEDIIDDGGDDWLVVQSAFRTTSRDYAAVRLV